MNECIDCGEITNNGKPRCYVCWDEFQYDNNPKYRANEIAKNLIFNYQLIKGKFAEVIVERLLVSCEFEVFKFGMENTVPNLPDSFYNPASKIGKEIRSMPDFLVTDSDDNLNYVEVKYRKNGVLNYKDLIEGYRYESGLLILLSSNDIRAMSIKELKSKKIMTPINSKELWELDNFEFEEYEIELVKAYKELVSSVFKDL